MRLLKKLLENLNDAKNERKNINKLYKTLTRGSHKNGTVGVEYPGDGHQDSVYVQANAKIQDGLRRS